MAYEDIILEDATKKVKELKEVWSSRLHHIRHGRSIGVCEQAFEDGQYKMLRDCLRELHKALPDWGGTILPKE